ncbi:MAG: PilZ domain-containing protein [Bacteriovoracaceae bacterium]|nr:PilZ domain-containing protein [Bacteriovoracaceae bacterium]
MKVLDFDRNGDEVLNIYHILKTNKIEICLWQKTKDYLHDRLQYRFHLDSINFGTFVMNFSQVQHRKINFRMGKIFCYCEAEAFIFSASIIAIGTYKISIELPNYIYLLNEHEAHMVQENKWVELQSIFKEYKRPAATKTTQRVFTEDERYKDVRETPRGKPSEQKTVVLRKLMVNSKVEREFNLFDLSQGGCALLIKDPFFFEKGTQVELVRIDNEYFTPELLGEVMSVNLNGEGASQYKVGIKFLGSVK